MKDPLLKVRVFLRRWSVKTLFLSSLRRSNSDFYVSDFRLLLITSYSKSPVQRFRRRFGLLFQNITKILLEKVVKESN